MKDFLNVGPILAPFILVALGYIGYQLKTIPNIIWKQIRKRLIYSIHIEETTVLYEYFENWLKEFNSVFLKNAKASIAYDYTIPGKVIEKVHLQHFVDTFILKYKGKRLVVHKGREKIEHSKDIKTLFYNSFTIEGWFAESKIKELLSEVLEYNKSIKNVKQTIFTNRSDGEWSEFGEIYGKSMESIILKEKQDILDNIIEFTETEEWYCKRGLSYKRGYLFYGSPGNGKTSFCLALAKKLNKDIQFLNLNDLEKDSHLLNAFRWLRHNSIIVIEDVDVIFGTRDGKSKISFSALLNCMDGAFSKYGIIIIMTTNHIDKIDPALIREGRIDMRVKIDNPEIDMVEEYMSIFYNTKVKLDNYKSSMSMSKIQEICLLNKNSLENAKDEIYKNICVKKSKNELEMIS